MPVRVVLLLPDPSANVISSFQLIMDLKDTKEFQSLVTMEGIYLQLQSKRRGETLVFLTHTRLEMYADLKDFPNRSSFQIARELDQAQDELLTKGARLRQDRDSILLHLANARRAFYAELDDDIFADNLKFQIINSLDEYQAKLLREVRPDQDSTLLHMTNIRLAVYTDCNDDVFVNSPLCHAASHLDKASVRLLLRLTSENDDQNSMLRRFNEARILVSS